MRSQKMVTLTEYRNKYGDKLPNRGNLIRWIKSGVLEGFQLCRCLNCSAQYRLENFDLLGGKYISKQVCPNCPSTQRAGGDFYVVPTPPGKIKRPKAGRRWPKKETNNR